jgi:hypothetical protein
MAAAVTTRRGLLDMQVCVPKEWTDAQVETFANADNPCGTSLGWQIRREGSPLLAGKPERVTCSTDADHVHIMLDA